MPRTIQTVVSIGLVAVMLLLMLSGISMSGYIFAFLPFGLGVATARMLHMVCAYEGFLLMSFHIGLHGGFIKNMAKHIFRLKKDNKYGMVGLRGIAGGICIYGCYVLLKRDIIKYITMQMHFVFFDYEEPIVFFVIDYACIMGTMIVFAYYIQKWLVTRKR